MSALPNLPTPKRRTHITAVSPTVMIPAPCECAYIAEITISDALRLHEILETLMSAEDRALTLLAQQDRLDEVLAFGSIWGDLNAADKLIFVQNILGGMTVSDAAHEVEIGA